MRLSLITLVWLTACPAAKQAPAIDENDPLVRKLQAEQARLAQPALPSQADVLARVATSDDQPTVLPASAGQMHFGDVVFKVKRLEQSHTVKGEKLSLSTAEAFLKLTLTAEATHSQTFDLSGTTLELSEQVHPIDPTAQRVGNGSELQPTVGPEARDLVLYFELPTASVKPGLKLLLRSADATAELALQ